MHISAIQISLLICLYYYRRGLVDSVCGNSCLCDCMCTFSLMVRMVMRWSSATFVTSVYTR